MLGIGTGQELIFVYLPPRPCIFRIARGYLLHSLIFAHSLRIFKDFVMQIMNTAVFVKIFIFSEVSTFSYLQSYLLQASITQLTATSSE